MISEEPTTQSKANELEDAINALDSLIQNTFFDGDAQAP